MRLTFLCLFCAAALPAQTPRPGVNYDEAKVGNHPLPGLGLTTAEEWTARRRPEILRLFEDHVFGKTPAGIGAPRFEVTAVKTDALGGKATRKLIHISLADRPAWAGMDVMLYLPNGAEKPVGCFVGLSFGANHAVSPEKDVPLSTRWMRDNKEKTVVNNRATEANRGAESGHWPLELILGQGYALATAYCGDIEPDHADGWKTGVRGVVSPAGAETLWKDGEWGGIGAWAWGLGRMVDYLETEPLVDAKQLAVIGHSRLGKTALWAGAQDTRFAVVISNESGEGGAALMRRDFGETTAIITKSFPHWFAPRYAGYAGKAPACPVDMHMLISLAAPRPIYIASAEGDTWADPKGEFLSGWHANPVYELFGRKGTVVDAQPPLETPAGDFIGYHIRRGKHDITAYDWTQYFAFAKRHAAAMKR